MTTQQEGVMGHDGDTYDDACYYLNRIAEALEAIVEKLSCPYCHGSGELSNPSGKYPCPACEGSGRILALGETKD
jgi:hypothetical protein